MPKTLGVSKRGSACKLPGKRRVGNGLGRRLKKVVDVPQRMISAAVLYDKLNQPLCSLVPSKQDFFSAMKEIYLRDNPPIPYFDVLMQTMPEMNDSLSASPGIWWPLTDSSFPESVVD